MVEVAQGMSDLFGERRGDGRGSMHFGKKKKKRKMTLQEAFPQHEIGEHSYSAGGLKVFSWNEGAVLRIGDYCSIAHDVEILLGGEHRHDWVTTFPFNVLWPSARHLTGHPRSKGDVVIGNDVWIGAGAIIMSGVAIGDGAVVAARAVVTKDVAPYAMVAGNPARAIRKRFDDDTIRRLLRIRWWDWDEERIRRLTPLMLSSELSAFLEEAESA
jgi:chloramphenicol O-acetyltransferase type B